MKNQKYHTVGTFPKSKGKIVETEVKFIPLTYKYMTPYFLGLVQSLQ